MQLETRPESEFKPDFSFLTPQDFPVTFELLPYQGDCDWDEQFQIGLNLILAGTEVGRERQ